MDCHEATAELKNEWEKLGIETSVVKRGGKVKDNWPCVEFSVTFKKNGVSETFPWRCGIGYAKWPENPFSIATKCKTKGKCDYIDTLKSGKVLKDKVLTAKLASIYTPLSVVNPSEIFSRILADMPEMTFEEWAREFGYDTDSRKAEKTYNLCLEYGFKAQNFVSPEQKEILITLVNML